MGAVMDFNEEAGADFLTGTAGAAFVLDAVVFFTTGATDLTAGVAAGLTVADLTAALDTLAGEVAFWAGLVEGVVDFLPLGCTDVLSDGSAAVFWLAGATVFLAGAF
jgi:hypothetical protein